jgi:hypothetical protein
MEKEPVAGGNRKPKLVLHVGMPKTGSTAIQTRLAASRGMLKSQGILYPRSETDPAHHFLVFLLDFVNRAPRLLSQQFGRDTAAAQANFARAWDDVRDEVGETRPEFVILSSEYLFKRIVAEQSVELAQHLRDLFVDPTIVVYVRRPSGYFGSDLQQRVRFSGILSPPGPLTIRHQIEALEALFPGAVRVLAYDRAVLSEGDVTTDLFARGLGRKPPRLSTPVRVNDSITAEAAAILQNFQNDFLPNMHDRRTREKMLLREVLAAAEAEVPGAKPPRLRADLADYLDEGSLDLLWLRDRYNVAFPGIDYARIRPLEPPTRGFGSIADYFELDTRRMKHLEAAVLQRSKSLRAFISNAPIRHRLIRFWPFPSYKRTY